MLTPQEGGQNSPRRLRALLEALERQRHAAWSQLVERRWADVARLINNFSWIRQANWARRRQNCGGAIRRRAQWELTLRQAVQQRQLSRLHGKDLGASRTLEWSVNHYNLLMAWLRTQAWQLAEGLSWRVVHAVYAYPPTRPPPGWLRLETERRF